VQLLELDRVDHLGEENRRVRNVRHDLVQLLLLAQVKTLAQRLLTHKASLVRNVRGI